MTALYQGKGQLKTKPRVPTLWTDNSEKYVVCFQGRAARTEPSLPTRLISVVHANGNFSSFLYPPPTLPLLQG